MANTTFPPDIQSLPVYTLYPTPPLIPPFSDFTLSLTIPVIAYWTTSLIFHWIDTRNLFSQYRIHTSAEQQARNNVSRCEALRGVITNQIIQTILGIGLGRLLGTEELTGKADYDITIWAARLRYGRSVIPSLLAVVGIDAGGLAQKLAGLGLYLAALLADGNRHLGITLSTMPNSDREIATKLLAEWETTLASAIYWYGIPTLQFALALFVADTWQYFGHRWEHANKWWYRNVHIRHHQLYVPYAFGAAYTHPLEGLVLDSVGTIVINLVTGFSLRQGMWFNSFISIKAVSDHGGYVFPWDPMRVVSDNDAYFHDLHHQRWGMKNHFAAHTAFWDRLMGTLWTDGEAARKFYARSERAALGTEKEREGWKAEEVKSE